MTIFGAKIQNLHLYLTCYFKHFWRENSNLHLYLICYFDHFWRENSNNLPNCINHVQTHFNTTFSMIIIGIRKPRDAIVTVTQDLDSKTTIFLFKQRKRKIVQAVQIDKYTCQVVLRWPIDRICQKARLKDERALELNIGRTSP